MQGAEKQKEQERWRQWNESQDDSARNNLIEYYLPLFASISCAQWQRLPVMVRTNITADDLLSAIVLELPAAIARYDAGKGTQPATYLGIRARFIILDYLRSLDWVPRLARSSGEKVTGLTSLDNHWLQRQADGSGCFGSAQKTEHRALASADGRPAQIDLSEGISHLLERLPSKHRLAFRFYFYHGKTMKQVGAMLCLSGSRVSQIITSDLKRFRETITEEQAEALRHSG